jgi:hypothetical protein
MKTIERYKPFCLKVLLFLTLCCSLNAFTLPSHHTASTANHDLRADAAILSAHRTVLSNGPLHDHSNPTRLFASTLSGGGGEKEEPTLITKIQSFAEKNFFLLGMVVAVSCARLFPAVRKNE